MAKTTIGIYEIRNAARKRQFSDLFPEHRSLFESYWSKPGCGECWRNLLRAISSDVERIKSFFGDVEVDIGEAPPSRRESLVSAALIVVNCRIDELQGRIDDICANNSGTKTFATGRWMNEVTTVVEIIDVPSDHKHVVINTDVRQLSGLLAKLDIDHPGPKQTSLARYEDHVTAIITLFQ